SIVIPAFNEEEAIGSTVRRCLDERSGIMNDAGISEVEVIVVDDGSSDRTAEVVTGFPDIKLIQHGRNRGYGAALKTGFAEAKGDIVGFSMPMVRAIPSILSTYVSC